MCSSINFSIKSVIVSEYQDSRLLNRILYMKLKSVFRRLLA